MKALVLRFEQWIDERPLLAWSMAIAAGGNLAILARAIVGGAL